MFVHRLQEFIAALLTKKDQLNKYDRVFLRDILRKYNKSNQTNVLTQAELGWLQKCFIARELQVAGTVDDYTFYNSEQSDSWIGLAKDLSADLNIPYLFILMPSLDQPENYAELSYLEELFEAHHLYLKVDNTPGSTGVLQAS